MMRPIAKIDRESLADWLAATSKPPGAIERFWRLVIASALNADLDSIAVPYAAKVIRELFMNSAEAGAMGMSSVPLSELYGRRSTVPRRSRQRSSISTPTSNPPSGTKQVSQWTVNTRAGTLVSDFLVIALPFEAMQKLLPHLPRASHGEELARKVERFEHWPICSVHLWFDREITDLPHAVLLDREIHWMYNKSVLQPWRKPKAAISNWSSPPRAHSLPSSAAGHRRRR